MATLAALRELWRHREAVLLGLVLLSCALLWGAGQRIRSLKSQLAQRPQVEAHSETTKTKEPKKIRERVERRKATDGSEIIVTHREIETGREETTTSRDSVVSPVGVYLPKRWIVGAGTSPLDRKAVMVRGGVTLFDTLDLTAGWAFFGPAETRPRLEAAWRF